MPCLAPVVLGDVTEDLALRLGDVPGGLLNATFGEVHFVVTAQGPALTKHT